jgi:hypothetical protein
MAPLALSKCNLRYAAGITELGFASPEQATLASAAGAPRYGPSVRLREDHALAWLSRFIGRMSWTAERGYPPPRAEGCGADVESESGQIRLCEACVRGRLPKCAW